MTSTFISVVSCSSGTDEDEDKGWISLSQSYIPYCTKIMEISSGILKMGREQRVVRCWGSRIRHE